MMVANYGRRATNDSKVNQNKKTALAVRRSSNGTNNLSHYKNEH